MTTAALLAQAREAGLTLLLEPPETIVVRGPPEVRARWLPTIREHKPFLLEQLRQTDQAIVTEVLERTASDAGTRDFYLRQTAVAAVPGFYERALGITPQAIATLDHAQREEAVRLGVLPREIAEADLIVLAYRHKGAQGLMTIPAERYDGLRVLELFDLNGRTK